MSKNMRGQLNWAINSHFKEGIDKHADKRNNGWDMSTKVYSYSSRRNLIDFSKTISNWAKANEGINKIQDLTPEATQRFLQEKAKECTQNTINAYASNLRKLEMLANETYGIDSTFGTSIVTPPAITAADEKRGVDAVIPRDDLDKIVERCMQDEHESSYAIRLADELGIRVQELATLRIDAFDAENKTLTITNAKGNKEYVRDLSDNAVNLVQEVVEHNFHQERLFSIQPDSINKRMGDLEKELELEAHSIHDIRRLKAQELYDELRDDGYTIEQAVTEVSHYLNHGDDRMAMLKECYIKLH